jgi:hypothetical protein
MSSLTADGIRALVWLLVPGIALVAGAIGIYRSDRATDYALRLTARPGFHRSVKLLSAVGFGVLALALLTDVAVLSGPRGYAVSLGALVATGGLLFGYANVELLASRAELREHPSLRGDGGGDSVLDAWRRSERRYRAWQCLLREHHDGAYWAFFAVGVLFVPGGFAALFLNDLLGVLLLVYMLAIGFVSLVAAVLVAYRIGYELNCDDVEGLDAAVEAARSRV